ncbi:hypothetical protein CERSUDRAFT_113775 [Gelatoporia subvermispora B]|uniref:Uncharacterized protein n=1 Tax=Ceriporiopsis subvermispora (strain B) TaxID=914234 RepID=M2RIG0_CERS8|nr:hypothetical protein CERSUDRAFT_113775 [Gelatoporia subvermispora B]
MGRKTVRWELDGLCAHEHGLGRIAGAAKARAHGPASRWASARCRSCWPGSSAGSERTAPVCACLSAPVCAPGKLCARAPRPHHTTRAPGLPCQTELKLPRGRPAALRRAGTRVLSLAYQWTRRPRGTMGRLRVAQTVLEFSADIPAREHTSRRELAQNRLAEIRLAVQPSCRDSDEARPALQRPRSQVRGKRRRNVSRLRCASLCTVSGSRCVCHAPATSGASIRVAQTLFRPTLPFARWTRSIFKSRRSICALTGSLPLCTLPA